MKAGRALLAEHLDELPLVRDIIADRGYRGLAALAARKQLGLHIKAPPKGSSGFVPLAPSTRSSTRSLAWVAGGGFPAATRAPRRARGPGSKWSASPIEVVCLAYLFARLRAIPT